MADGANDLLETLLEKIVGHPTYGPAMESAARAGRTLVLNWHDHGDGGRWCVSVCAKVADPTKILQIGMPDLEELVHVKGIGTSAEEGRGFCAAFGPLLRERYGLDHVPQPFLNGVPM